MDKLVVGKYYYASNISIEDVLQQKKAGRIFNRKKCTSIRGKFKLDNGVYRYMKYWKRAVGEENKGMKIEDVKIGMKVVPHDKNGMFPGEGLEGSNEWCRAKNIGQQYLYVNLYDGDIVICSAEKAQFNSGDYFLASDLTPYNEQYICTVPGVTVDLIPGKEYWVSDASQENAIKYKITRKYICTVKGSHLFETEDGVHASRWNYAVEPETEMTVEEIAEALRSKGIITGKLKIKE